MRRDTAADHLASPSTAPCRGDWIRWKRAAASSIQLARSRTRLMLEARRGRPARKSQPARAAANVQPSVVSDQPVSSSITAAKVPISTFLLGQMVEHGEIPAPITLGRRTRYYSYETFTQVVKAVRAKLEQRS